MKIKPGKHILCNVCLSGNLSIRFHETDIAHAVFHNDEYIFFLQKYIYCKTGFIRARVRLKNCVIQMNQIVLRHLRRNTNNDDKSGCERHVFLSIHHVHICKKKTRLMS